MHVGLDKVQRRDQNTVQHHWSILKIPLVLYYICPNNARWMEKISWTDHVRNKEVLLRVKKQRNILHEIRKRKANWIGHICVETAFYNGLLKERYKGG
jgi:hypothetical protein